MSERNTVLRSLHDVGLATWFGGALMGAVGLNGATGQANEPSERLRLSSLGWKLWSPVVAGAIAAHGVGGLGLIAANRRRVDQDSGTRVNTYSKAGLTIAAAGLTLYAGVLGRKVESGAPEGADGATTPGESTPHEVAAAQRQLKVIQLAIPVLTGVVVVLGAQQGEQQRPTQQLVGRLTRGLNL
ncbi:hypothetical protein G5V58_21325 [Nocardioides anomalus]|uniref:Uncharacterized protein n=1 Tax=Nocardioides anomalus TaxID=2712223 RepID=A0A6G6WIC4_9ACTN|nr:hypothetical protein [Nocardioides anomalus]QIG44972.1 hypothetical protein G5V58_21325 [Nocardioides anomalus]